MQEWTTFLAVLLPHETGCSTPSPYSEAPFLGKGELTPPETFAAACKQKTTQDLALDPGKSEKLKMAKATANVSH